MKAAKPDPERHNATKLTRLSNGICVVTEEVPEAASCSVGVWIETGSRHETPRTMGVSHFIEHLLFKGTPTRNACRIAEEIESLGGTINAFTTKEHTCFHTRTLAEHVETALDVLSDIVLNSLLRPEDIEVEREVILQEIFDCEDSPEDFIHDYFLAQYWPGHPLGWPVTGTAESVMHLTRDDIVAYLRDRYRPDRVIIAAAGRLNHEAFVAQCAERFGAMIGRGHEDSGDRPDFQPGIFVSRREIEQVHVIVGLPGLALVDERRQAMELLVTALGGGMSSRLFQKIREERGLAYSVYAFQSPFRDIGYTGIYAATSKDHVAEVVERMLDEISDVLRRGLKHDEIARTKRQLVGSIPLGLESTESRMLRLARNQTYFRRDIPVEEEIAEIEAITAGAVQELARDVFAFDRLGIALLGDAEEEMISLPVG